MHNKSQSDDASDLSDDDSRKRRNSDEVSVGGRLSYYLVPCHPYGDKHPNQRDFGINIVALMPHEFTSLSFVDHDFFRKMTKDLDPFICPVGRSKLSQSLIPTEKQLVENYFIDRLEK